MDESGFELSLALYIDLTEVDLVMARTADRKHVPWVMMLQARPIKDVVEPKRSI